jgi:hypothetical protein
MTGSGGRECRPVQRTGFAESVRRSERSLASPPYTYTMTYSLELSSAARRAMGVHSKPAPRVRHPNEALPPTDDFRKRPKLCAADLGGAQFVRPGADVVYRSLGPFRGGAI